MLIRILNALASASLGFACVCAVLVTFRMAEIEATTPILLALAVINILIGSVAGKAADALDERQHRKERP